MKYFISEEAKNMINKTMSGFFEFNENITDNREMPFNQQLFYYFILSGEDIEDTRFRNYVGYADQNTYSGSSTSKGTINVAKSYSDNEKIHYAFDFPSHCAKKEIHSIGFGSKNFKHDYRNSLNINIGTGDPLFEYNEEIYAMREYDNTIYIYKKYEANDNFEEVHKIENANVGTFNNGNIQFYSSAFVVGDYVYIYGVTTPSDGTEAHRLIFKVNLKDFSLTHIDIKDFFDNTIVKDTTTIINTNGRYFGCIDNQIILSCTLKLSDESYEYHRLFLNENNGTFEVTKRDVINKHAWYYQNIEGKPYVQYENEFYYVDPETHEINLNRPIYYADFDNQTDISEILITSKGDRAYWIRDNLVYNRNLVTDNCFIKIILDQPIDNTGDTPLTIEFDLFYNKLNGETPT